MKNFEGKIVINKCYQLKILIFITFAIISALISVLSSSWLSTPLNRSGLWKVCTRPIISTGISKYIDQNNNRKSAHSSSLVSSYELELLRKRYRNGQALQSPGKSNVQEIRGDLDNNLNKLKKSIPSYYDAMIFALNPSNRKQGKSQCVLIFQHVTTSSTNNYDRSFELLLSQNDNNRENNRLVSSRADDFVTGLQADDENYLNILGDYQIPPGRLVVIIFMASSMLLLIISIATFTVTLILANPGLCINITLECLIASAITLSIGLIIFPLLIGKNLAYMKEQAVKILVNGGSAPNQPNNLINVNNAAFPTILYQNYPQTANRLYWALIHESAGWRVGWSYGMAWASVIFTLGATLILRCAKTTLLHGSSSMILSSSSESGHKLFPSNDSTNGKNAKTFSKTTKNGGKNDKINVQQEHSGDTASPSTKSIACPAEDYDESGTIVQSCYQPMLLQRNDDNHHVNNYAYYNKNSNNNSNHYNVQYPIVNGSTSLTTSQNFQPASVVDNYEVRYQNVTSIVHSTTKNIHNNNNNYRYNEKISSPSSPYVNLNGGTTARNIYNDSNNKSARSNNIPLEYLHGIQGQIV